ncbi:MAG: hypothetical protein R3279_04370 [Putridiphycobacter sp.]|nr:hypothetical protein [Putridiphycobacter sp.]
MTGKYVIFSLALLVNLWTSSQQSPFNSKIVNTDSTNNYQYIVSGHFHGSGTNHTGYPINSLLANIDQLNNGDYRFLVCLGDLFKDVSNDIPFYEQSFFSKLNIPLFNTVGNHDLTADIYQQHYGQTDFQFTINQDRHLFFDTEANNGSFSDEQLTILNQTLEAATTNSIRQVFIYCHRTVWAKHYTEFEGLFEDNTQAVFGNNFSKTVFPIIQKIGEKVPVYWFSGSIGDAPASFFYHRDEASNLTYIASAIRGFKRDAWLKVMISETGIVSFETISLTGQKLKKLQDYNVDFWQSTSAKEPFNYRLIFYYTKLIVLHRAFWYGIITSFSLILLYIVLKRRRIQKKSQ